MAFELTRFGIAEDDLPLTWETQSLGSLAFFNLEKIGRNYAHDVIQYLDIGNVTKGAVGAPLRVHLQDAPSRAQRIVRDNDTIISTVRPGNRAFAFLREPPVNLIVSTGFAVLRAKPRVNARFIYYLSTCDVIIDYLATVAEEKSAYPSVIPSDIAECVVPVPPESEQRAIAHILGTLDDRIELNRRMSATCEAMARAVFKDWFVDFGPTRAKQEGRDPGLPPHLTAVFPDSLDADGKPEGWKARPVGDFAELRGGKQLEKKRISTTGTIPVFGGAGIMGFTDEHNSDGFVISVGRVGAYCGQFFSHQGKAWINNNASLIHPLEGVSGEWLFQSLRHADIEVIKKGAAQPFVSNTDVANMPLIWPGENIVRRFTDIVAPLMLKIEQNNGEASTLSALRDTLLPKLISGEIRVKDAEKHVGEAT